ERNGERKTWRVYRDSRPNHPVVCVSFYDAQEFCHWSGLALPTADQWRRAFRGDDLRVYPWGNDFDKNRCNTAESCMGMETTPVDNFPDGRSPFGCYDMVGNVEEWTNSQLEGGRIILGGSWSMSCEIFSIAVMKRYASPDYYSGDLGFRCVDRAVSA